MQYCKFCPEKEARKYYQVVRPNGSDPMVFLCMTCTANGPMPVTEAPVQVRREPTFFAAWSDANQIMFDGRSRFDWLRENLPKAKSIEAARHMIACEGFGERYPIVPEWNFSEGA